MTWEVNGNEDGNRKKKKENKHFAVPPGKEREPVVKGWEGG